MNLPGGISKWGVGVLGVVCVFLGAHLVSQYRDMQPRTVAAAAAVPHAVKPSDTEKAQNPASHAADDLARYDPTIHFDDLKGLDARPLPDDSGHPFGVLAVVPPATKAADTSKPNTPPPPPPPPPLKAMGYNELPGGQKEAMVQYNEDMEVVHEGDTIGTKFKVMKITPTAVVVENDETHESLQLPFPQ